MNQPAEIEQAKIGQADPKRAEIDAACMRTLDDFMAALNAYDADAMDATMRFPHLRFAGGVMKFYDAPGSNPMDLFTRLREEDQWKYSRWESRELVQYNDNKAHYALSYTRFRDDDSVIGVYESLYVMTHGTDGWRIQARSSFGP